MAREKKLTARAVRDWAGDFEIGKGRPYAEGRTVSGTVLIGNTLKASVQGSRDRPYRVQITLGDGEVQSADCSCPVGSGGRCKHVAAVLLTYLEHPDRFAEVDNLDTNLQARDKAELIALIKQMVRRAPELEPLLAAPLPGFGKKAAADPAIYRRQAIDAIRDINPYDEWGGDEIAGGLYDILETGREFEAAKDFASAAAVYQGITSAITEEGIDYLDAYDGDSDVMGTLATGLIRCFTQTPTGSAKRESLLRSLASLLELSNHLGIDEDGNDQLDALLAVVTPDERRTLSGWLKQNLKKSAGDSYTRDYRARRIADLLLTIDADVLDDEQYLEHCRRFGMRDELLVKLIELGRKDEAVREVAAITNNNELLSAAELLARHRLGAEAERLVRERPNWEKEAYIVRWLKQRAEARKDGPEAARLSELMLGLWPNMSEYFDIKKWIGKNEWPAKREKLLKQLERAKSYGLLTDIFLKEGEVDEAIRVMRLDKYSHRTLDVAKAAEETRPEVATEIYRKQAERNIEARHREAYKEACKLLKKVGELMTRQGQAAEFRTYIGELSEKYRALRAFQEELRNAKLLTEVPPTAVALKPKPKR